MLSDCYLSCLSVLPVLSVTLVHCGHNMKLGMQVGLGRRHIVLDGDTTPPPPKGHTPNFWPMSVVAKWLDGLRCHLDGGRPWPRRLCARWGPSCLSKRGQSPLPNFWSVSIFFPNFQPMSIVAVAKRLNQGLHVHAKCRLLW